MFLIDFSSRCTGYCFEDLLNLEYELVQETYRDELSQALIQGYSKEFPLFIPDYDTVKNSILDNDRSEIAFMEERGETDNMYYINLKTKNSQGLPSFIPLWARE